MRKNDKSNLRGYFLPGKKINWFYNRPVRMICRGSMIKNNPANGFNIFLCALNN